jgi:hypothetical protein
LISYSSKTISKQKYRIFIAESSQYQSQSNIFNYAAGTVNRNHISELKIIRSSDKHMDVTNGEKYRDMEPIIGTPLFCFTAITDTRIYQSKTNHLARLSLEVNFRNLTSMIDEKAQAPDKT